MRKREILLALIILPFAFYCTEEKNMDAAPERKPLGYIGSPDDGYGDVGTDVRDTHYEASSILKEANLPEDTFEARRARASYYTSWCEGVTGPGIGEWVKITMTGEKEYDRCPPPEKSYSLACKNHMHELSRIRIMNGFTKTENLYYANNRVKKLLVEFSGGENMTIEVKDDRNLKYKGKYPAPQVFHVNRIQAKWVKFTILEVYKGNKYDDTCLSELSLGHDDGGWERPEGSYQHVRERKELIAKIEDKYGKLSSKQVEFVKLNITMVGGGGLISDLGKEMRENPDKFHSISDVLGRICELNRMYSKQCLHPEWIGENK